ncbi:putative phosphatidate phosphatase [Arctopsyche grandis]|uniref:putative phosphatidate phosphatase n=1 Tax=Arctopsyche grandis TaxID=121162 RepID=UPI00406D6700
MEPDQPEFNGKKIIFDLFLLCCVGSPILYISLWVEPFETGFFCDDESLRHPFKPSTVTRTMLYIFGLGGPIILILVTEFVLYIKKKKHERKKSRLLFMRFNVSPWIWSSYNTIGVFGFGVACQQLATDIAKYTVGRLRPHFFDVCQPDIDCDAVKNRWAYIQNFTCKGTDPHLLKEMRLSFPSGHSSFSTFTMIYVAVYVQRRFKWAGSKLLRHGCQFIVFMLAWFTILSRISDNKHHRSDVLAGSCIGAVTAILIFGCVSNLWKPKSPISSPKSENTNDTNAGTPDNGNVGIPMQQQPEINNLINN